MYVNFMARSFGFFSGATSTVYMFYHESSFRHLQFITLNLCDMPTANEMSVLARLITRAPTIDQGCIYTNLSITWMFSTREVSCEIFDLL